jgi:gliotoxin/aspirochlorine biosynthesis thioredoxin reductase
MASKIYDALIIGSGPSGLSTALSLSRIHRTVAIFTRPDNAGYRNQGVHAMHNVLSRDGAHPEEFRRIGREQIKRYGTADFFEAEIVKASKVKCGQKEYDGFRIVDGQGSSWTGRKLVLAMGVKDVFPDIPGYRENWPLNM